jgi:hypothetical protein
MIRVLRRSSYEAPAKEEPDHEDEIPFGGAAGRTATCFSACRSGASAREPNRDRGARGRGSALELCLHERPGSKRVRRAHVGLREPSLRLAIQERVLKSTCLPALRQIAGHPSGKNVTNGSASVQLSDPWRGRAQTVANAAQADRDRPPRAANVLI